MGFNWFREHLWLKLYVYYRLALDIYSFFLLFPIPFSKEWPVSPTVRITYDWMMIWEKHYLSSIWHDDLWHLWESKKFGRKNMKTSQNRSLEMIPVSSWLSTSPRLKDLSPLVIMAGKSISFLNREHSGKKNLYKWMLNQGVLHDI